MRLVAALLFALLLALLLAALVTGAALKGGVKSPQNAADVTIRWQDEEQSQLVVYSYTQDEVNGSGVILKAVANILTMEATGYSIYCGTGDGYTATMTRPRPGDPVRLRLPVIQRAVGPLGTARGEGASGKGQYAGRGPLA